MINESLELFSYLMVCLVMAVSLNEACKYQGTVHGFVTFIKENPTKESLKKALMHLPLYKFTLYVAYFMGGAYYLRYLAMGGMLDLLHMGLMFIVMLNLIPTVRFRLNIENRRKL